MFATEIASWKNALCCVYAKMNNAGCLTIEELADSMGQDVDAIEAMFDTQVSSILSEQQIEALSNAESVEAFVGLCSEYFSIDLTNTFTEEEMTKIGNILSGESDEEVATYSLQRLLYNTAKATENEIEFVFPENFGESSSATSGASTVLTFEANNQSDDDDDDNNDVDDDNTHDNVENTGVVLDIVLPVAIIAFTLAATVVVLKKKEQY